MQIVQNASLYTWELNNNKNLLSDRSKATNVEKDLSALDSHGMIMNFQCDAAMEEWKSQILFHL